MGLQGLLKGCIAGLAGRIFRAVAWRVLGIHVLHRQRNGQFITQFLAARCKLIGRALQAMVHMHCPHLPWPTLCTGEQQGSRVGSSTKSDHKRKARAETSQGLFGGG
jgi:DNA-binding transcriptional regulator YdaS (Cro superfamily)